MEREDTAWAMAQWVAQHRGCDARRYIAEQIGRLISRGEAADVELWRNVAAHFDKPGVSLPA